MLFLQYCDAHCTVQLDQTCLMCGESFDKRHYRCVYNSTENLSMKFWCDHHAIVACTTLCDRSVLEIARPSPALPLPSTGTILNIFSSGPAPQQRHCDHHNAQPRVSQAVEGGGSISRGYT